MRREIYVAGINTRPLASAAAELPFWLLSATLLRRANGGMPEWIQPMLYRRSVIWDPGTFSEKALSYPAYRTWIDRHARSYDQYLQYDEIGDAEVTQFYLADMRRRGYDPIPVLQPGGNEQLLHEPRCAVGGTVPMTRRRRIEYLDDLFYGRIAHSSGKLHILGMHKEEWFRRYPFASGDSTTWIPRGEYNRRKSIVEWLREYGEHDIPLDLPKQRQEVMVW